MASLAAFLLDKFDAVAIRARTSRGLALCGLIGPVPFTALVIVESLLRSGYSQISNVISDLGVGPHAILQDINFWLFGPLVIAFAVGLRSGLSAPGSAARVGPALVGVGGAGIFLAGVFPDSPYPYPGAIHLIVSFVSFFALMAAMFVTWRAQSAESKWGRSPTFSVVMGLLSVVTFALVPLLSTGSKIGLFQRLFVATSLVWIASTGAKLSGIFSPAVVPSSGA